MANQEEKKNGALDEKALEGVSGGLAQENTGANMIHRVREKADVQKCGTDAVEAVREKWDIQGSTVSPAGVDEAGTQALDDKWYR